MAIRITNSLAHISCILFSALGHVAHAQSAPSLQNTSAVSQQLDNMISVETNQQPEIQGRLPNGLRYAILSRKGQETGVAVGLRVTGGFLAEQRPGERGLAHLIEHVIFHSPTKSAPNELRRFRKIGFSLSLPEPAGGTTTWRESDYFLVSRTNLPADIDNLLLLFREVFSELTFRADAVDGQRDEVMREMSDKQLGNDIYASYIAAIAPGSPTDVIESQNSDDVPIASVEKIRGLYNRLYRPKNVTIVIVGDVDADKLKSMIANRFGDWKGIGPAEDRKPIPIFNPDKISPISYSNFKYGRNIATITNISPIQPVPLSRNKQIEARLISMLSTRAINDRFALSQKGFQLGKYGVFIENGEQGHSLINLWDNFTPGQWQSAVGGLAALSCDLRTDGFSNAEWALAKQNTLQELEARSKSMVTLSNFDLAKELSDTITDGRQQILFEELFNYARTWLPTVDAKAGNDWWQRLWDAGTEHIRVETPELTRVNEPITAIRTVADDATHGLGCQVRPS